MSIRITVDVFSGRPNPSVELDERESAAVLDRLMPLRRLGEGEPDLPSEPTLGYRGLVVEQIGDRREELPDVIRVAGSDVFGRGLAHRARDARVETYLISADGPLSSAGLDRVVLERLPEEAERFSEIRRAWPVTFPPIPFWPRRCRCGPLYRRPGGMCPPGSRSTTATTTRPTTAPTRSRNPGKPPAPYTRR